MLGKYLTIHYLWNPRNPLVSPRLTIVKMRKDLLEMNPSLSSMAKYSSYLRLKSDTEHL